MKLDRQIDAGIVASDGAKTTSSFSIATSSHMFNILSSGLYADKVKAVLREIGCNAMDAHIMAGKDDVPIEVKLPNPVDPTFYVKDFGPGLDEDEIRQLYTTYGWSAKQDSDEVTGAFGLGSKSPFAYTHSFTIQSSKGGKMWTMTAYQDEDGKPVITKVSEAEAPEDWPSGVMVTFAVERSDFDEFAAKAREVFQWFRVKPVILGANISLEEPHFDYRWGNYAFSKRGRDVAVVMGNVRYPVDIHILAGKGNLSPEAAGIAERSLTIWLPIGSAMMTPSRESLEYTKKTVSSIQAELEKAAATLYEAVLATLKEPASSSLEMQRRVYSLREALPHGVRTALTKAFESAQDDIKAIADATWLKYVNNSVALENWVGEGTRPTAPLLLDEAGRIRYDSNGIRLVQSDWKPAGARVYAIVLEKKGKRVKASRREVVHGRFVNTVDDKLRLHFNIESIPSLYVLDSTVGIAALKFHLEKAHDAMADGERVAAIVVAGAGRDALEKAVAHAGYLVANTVAFAESAPQLVSEALSDAIATVRASRKRYRTKNREEWLQQTVKEVSLVSGTHRELSLSDITLDAFEEDTEDQRYYIALYPNRVSHSTSSTLKVTIAGYEVQIPARQLANAIHDGVLSELCSLAGIEAERAIVVQNKAQLKAMKLESNGYQEFFTALSNAFQGDAEKRKQLGALVSTPVPDLGGYLYGHVKERIGIVGALAKQKQVDSLLWQRMSSRYPHHPVVLAAIAYHGMVDGQGIAIDPGKTLRAFLDSHASLKSTFGLQPHDYVDVFKMFDQAHEALPHRQVLNLDELGRMAASEGEVAATLLDMVFLLGLSGNQTSEAQAKKAA